MFFADTDILSAFAKVNAMKYLKRLLLQNTFDRGNHPGSPTLMENLRPADP